MRRAALDDLRGIFGLLLHSPILLNNGTSTRPGRFDLQSCESVVLRASLREMVNGALFECAGNCPHSNTLLSHGYNRDKVFGLQLLVSRLFMRVHTLQDKVLHFKFEAALYVLVRRLWSILENQSGLRNCNEMVRSLFAAGIYTSGHGFANKGFRSETATHLIGAYR